MGRDRSQANPFDYETPSAVCDPEALNRTLAQWNHERLGPCVPHPGWQDALAVDHRMRWLEGCWVEGLRQDVAARAGEAPHDPDGFLEWFEALKHDGPGQFDPLFDWLAEAASDDDMRWFLTQEAAGEAGFDDLVALTQIKMPPEPKLELARNYWDEMGRGHALGMHGPMLDRAVSALGLRPAIGTTVWESLAIANTLTALATTARYAWLSVGALGAVELTAPGRVSKIAEGMRRLGYPPVVRKYFDLHAALDVKHSQDWDQNVLRPAVAADPSLARPIAEGALIRLGGGARCFERYRRELWGESALAMAAE